MNKKVVEYIENKINAKEDFLRAYKIIKVALDVAIEALPYRTGETEQDKKIIIIANMIIEHCYLLLKNIDITEVIDALDDYDNKKISSLNYEQQEEFHKLINLFKYKILIKED